MEKRRAEATREVREAEPTAVLAWERTILAVGKKTKDVGDDGLQDAGRVLCRAAAEVGQAGISGITEQEE